MLPHSDHLPIPFREGIRDLRSSIRYEAYAGALSVRVLGRPEPTRGLARLADRILTRAEMVANRVGSRNIGDLGLRFDRLAVDARSGHLARRSADIYALCRAILEFRPGDGTVISEMRLVTDSAPATVADRSDPIRSAVHAASWMASLQVVRPCVSTVLTRGNSRSSQDMNDQLALTLWLAMLIRETHREDGHRAIESARRVFEAEGEQWVRLLREHRFDDLAALWRHTLPYLP